jgi:nuclear pore complex protein Nup107
VEDDEDEEGDGDDSALLQLQALRQSCIPKVCFLLHTVLHASRQYKKCLQLSDVVTSEKHKLYKDFTQGQLRQLLLLLHKSAMQMVSEPTTDELGYTIA